MTVNDIIKVFGRSVFLQGEDGWKSPIFNAFIQPLRYKNKLYVEGVHTPIGVNKYDNYSYMGPVSHDITKLDSSFRLVDSDKTKYIIDKSEKIYFGDSPVYIWAVIRKVKE